MLLSAPVLAGATEAPLLWRFSNGAVDASPGAPTGPLRIGSLQKPFVVRAWAEAHNGTTPTPHLVCHGGASCWLATGHGALGLARATAVSCNVYFRALAADTPPETLARVLREEGFTVEAPPSPETAIGLPDETGHTPVAIRPAELLAAYARIVREPWTTRDDVRRELLAGLRAAALDGTARGIGARGYYAKTGTAPSVDGHPLQTSGLALAVDSAGSGVLALIRRGTGREAGRALAEPLRAASASVAPAPVPGCVRVALFSLLHPRQVVARNLSGVPLSVQAGFVGAGGELALRPGERLSDGLWELRLPERGLSRRMHAAIEAFGLPDGSLELVAVMEPLEYVAGVAAAELPALERERTIALGAAALRFLGTGPRHAMADVCDSTHCAYFLGRGPRAEWSSGERARLVSLPATGLGVRFDPELLAEIRAEAARPGPSQWTSHCGGEPLSARFVWGQGSEARESCPRHAASDARPWERFWTEAEIAAALGSGVRDLRIATDGGVWRLRAETEEAGPREWLYDEAHRLLARRLGWGALPSPADRITREAAGFRAVGRGLGHRVGLCLGD